MTTLYAFVTRRPARALDLARPIAVIAFVLSALWTFVPWRGDLDTHLFRGLVAMNSLVILVILGAVRTRFEEQATSARPTPADESGQ